MFCPSAGSISHGKVLCTISGGKTSTTVMPRGETACSAASLRGPGQDSMAQPVSNVLGLRERQKSWKWPQLEMVQLNKNRMRLLKQHHCAMESAPRSILPCCPIVAFLLAEYQTDLLFGTRKKSATSPQRNRYPNKFDKFPRIKT